MSWFSKPKSKKDQMVEQRRRRRGEGSLPATHWFNAWQVLAVVLFLAMSGLVTAICFVGRSPTVAQFIVGDRARLTITAQTPFSYVSDLQTRREQKNASDLVGSSFRQDLSGESRLRQAVAALEAALDAFSADSHPLPTDAHSAVQQNAEQQAAACDKLARDFTEKQGFALDPRDVLALTQNTTSAQRAQAFDEGLMALHSILSQGIYDPTQQGFQSSAAKGELFNLDIPGRLTSAPVLSQEEALRELRINPAPVGVDPATQAAVFHVLKQAVLPNIAYDADRTTRERQAAAAAVKPQLVQVREGAVLIDPSSPVTPEQREALLAYQQELKLHGQNGLGWSNGLVQRFLFVTLLLAAAVIFIKSGLGQLDQSPKLYALTALLLLVNLALLRLVLTLGDTSLLAQRPILQAVLPWIAPTMFAPLIIAVMIGAAPATLAALLISILFSLMTGDTLEVFLVNFLASLVAIHFCREVRVRARLVRAGLFGGVAAAVCAAYLGFVTEGDYSHGILQQMLAAALTGLLTAVVAIGVLPVLENLFKITTDITLLELTDFNHPLLRKLQLAAPGSYHHSLMVANLAERAAAEIGANALLCRTCSLYHDIGKMVKPEYFTENQRDGFNPHEEVNPSMSALIIKSHVKEGLDLAQQYKLPQVIRDVISQHHGTTLIKYFYHKASLLQRQFATPVPFPRQRSVRAKDTPPNLPVAPPPPADFDDSAPDESFYRYDGPKPRFKESAIIALADCVEAASRSLRKVSPQAIEDLVESLFNDRIEDHQLDDSPITIQELKKINQSFNLSLVNMLHSRVQYPGGSGESGAPDKPAEAPAPAAPPAPAPKSPGGTIAVASSRPASSPA